MNVDSTNPSFEQVVINKVIAKTEKRKYLDGMLGRQKGGGGTQGLFCQAIRVCYPTYFFSNHAHARLNSEIVSFEIFSAINDHESRLKRALGKIYTYI